MVFSIFFYKYHHQTACLSEIFSSSNYKSILVSSQLKGHFNVFFFNLQFFFLIKDLKMQIALINKNL